MNPTDSSKRAYDIRGNPSGFISVAFEKLLWYQPYS